MKAEEAMKSAAGSLSGKGNPKGKLLKKQARKREMPPSDDTPPPKVKSGKVPHYPVGTNSEQFQADKKQPAKESVLAAVWEQEAENSDLERYKTTQVLREKYRALEEESSWIREELRQSDCELRQLQQKKYALLDELLVFEGFAVDPVPPFKILSGCNTSAS